MVNKINESQKYRDNLAWEIKNIRKTSEISDDIKNSLSDDELVVLEDMRNEKANKESQDKLDSARASDEYKKTKETKKQAQELVKKMMELTWKSKEEVEESVFGNKSENSEQKEDIEWLPKLEKDNFRIDSTNWKEIEAPNGVIVKENPEWDAWEYLEWNKKWEQLFTKASAIRETKAAGKKLPASSKVFENIINWKEENWWYNWDYQAFLLWEGYIDKDWNKTGKFCGWRNPYDKDETFNIIDEGFYIWCEDGSYFNGYYNEWIHYHNGNSYGFSVRCVQG